MKTLQVENERKKKSAISASVEEDFDMFSDGGDRNFSNIIGDHGDDNDIHIGDELNNYMLI